LPIPKDIIRGIEYFRGLNDHVTKKTPHIPLFPDVSPLASAAERAQQLADQILKKFPAGPIHIIAHSMGGLDSRVLIGNDLNGLAGRIASLTTLSTPHHGSPVADALAGPGAGDVLRAITGLIDRLGVSTRALVNLTADEANKLPDVVKTNPGVRCRSYSAGGRPKDFLPFAPITPPTSIVLLGPYGFVKSKSKGEDNDGLVTLSSATYGEFQRALQCDHADMIGYNLNGPLDPFQFPHLDLYDEIIAKLEQDGG